jgi:hypothetical protein
LGLPVLFTTTKISCFLSTAFHTEFCISGKSSDYEQIASQIELKAPLLFYPLSISRDDLYWIKSPALFVAFGFKPSTVIEESAKAQPWTRFSE